MSIAVAGAYPEVNTQRMLQSEGEALATIMLNFLDELVRCVDDSDREHLVKQKCVDINDLQAVKEYLLMSLLFHDEEIKKLDKDDLNDEDKQKIQTHDAHVEECIKNLKFFNKCIYEKKLFRKEEKTL